MQKPPSPGSSFGALLLAFVAGAIGGAAGALLMQPHGPAAGGVDDSGLKQTVAALDESVRALNAQVGALGRAVPPPGQRPSEPLPLPDGGAPSLSQDQVAALLTRLDDLSQALQGRAAGASGLAGSAPIAPLDASRAQGDHSALLALATEENDQRRQLWRRHAFWSCQQVLDAYGLPDQIETGDGGTSWYYDTGERMVQFEFYQGMLINVWN